MASTKCPVRCGGEKCPHPSCPIHWKDGGDRTVANRAFLARRKKARAFVKMITKPQ